MNLAVADQQLLSHTFDLPPSTWTSQYQDATGFFLGDHQKSNHAEIESLSTAFRFLIKNVTADKPTAAEIHEKIEYFWTEIGVWTRWKQSHNSALLCIVRDESGLDKLWLDAQDSLTKPNQHPRLGVDQPFFWHSFIMPYITKSFDDAVWACRDKIRHLEWNRPSTVPTTRPHFQTMHEMARHVIHLVEVLDMSITVVENMIENVKEFEEAPKKTKTNGADCMKFLSVLKCQKTLLECSRGRAEALNARLQNEITLVSQDQGLSSLNAAANNGIGIPSRERTR